MEKKQFKIGLGTVIMLFLLLIIILIGVTVYIISLNSKEETNIGELKQVEVVTAEDTQLEQTENVTVVPTMQDKITSDSSWCATFQLVWNDMKNEVVKKDIIFTPQEEIAENLNKEEFTEEMISDEYYYKKYGLKTLELKEEIKKGIKEKFNQESDILDKFSWSEDALNDPNNSDVKRYFFYTMLYRKFDFIKEFDKLDNGTFSKEYKDVKYFGIDGDTDDSVGDQIDILYYNSKDDFAIILNTKTNDEVILCKNPKGETFKEIYNNMNNEADKYEGSSKFKDIDEFKMPNLEFNIEREYKEVEGKEFRTADPIYDTAVIVKAIQTIKFSLDEKGGEIKSEAAIDVKNFITSVPEPKKEEPRYFYLDDTFVIFLREKGEDLPYFAGRIEDITKFQ